MYKKKEIIFKYVSKSITSFYLISFLFMLALRGLSSPKTSTKIAGIAGMAVTIVKFYQLKLWDWLFMSSQSF